MNAPALLAAARAAIALLTDPDAEAMDADRVTDQLRIALAEDNTMTSGTPMTLRRPRPMRALAHTCPFTLTWGGVDWDAMLCYDASDMTRPGDSRLELEIDVWSVVLETWNDGEQSVNLPAGIYVNPGDLAPDMVSAMQDACAEHYTSLRDDMGPDHDAERDRAIDDALTGP